MILFLKQLSAHFNNSITFLLKHHQIQVLSDTSAEYFSSRFSQSTHQHLHRADGSDAVSISQVSWGADAEDAVHETSITAPPPHPGPACLMLLP